MFQKLRFRLMLLCISVTALILTVLTALCLSVFEKGIREQEAAAFLSNLNTMYLNLQQQTVISHSWLRQMKQQYQFSLRLFDNGTPLLFQELSEDENSSAQLEEAEEIAAKDLLFSVRAGAAPKTYIDHREFSLSKRNRNAEASAALIPHGTGSLGVIVVHSLQPTLNRIFFYRIVFFLSDLMSLAALSVFFWLFILRILKPLQENRKKQIQFIASASHELRSPLTVIMSHVDAAKTGSLLPNRQFLDTLSEEGLRMDRLIRDMLQLASADNHTWDLRLSDVELDTLLLEVWEAYEPMAKTLNLAWSISIPEQSLARCRCDKDRIRQLLSVLIDNAFCYTPSGGNVRLSLDYRTDFRLTVTDNGPGIPDDQKQAVFERFYCADASHQKKTHYGLGLSIAKEIADLHGGQLLLSDAPGGGAAFTLILPRKLRT